MSASREKQIRQERANSGWVDPKTAKEAEQRKKEKRSNLLYGIIAAVFLIFAVAAVVWRSNVIPKMATAATVDGEKYTAAEVSFYYQNVYNSFYNNYYYYMAYGMISLNTSGDLSSQVLTENDASLLGTEAGQTWRDYFLDLALDQMASVQSALKQAEEAGFTYPAGVQAQYDDSIANLHDTAAASGVSADDLLKNNFGSLMTEKVYSEHLLRLLKYSAYADAYEASLTYSDSEINAAYEADPSSYDVVSYEYVTISGAAEGTTDADGNAVDPTEEEEAAALEAAKTTADEMLAAYQAGGDLEALAEASDASYNETSNGSYSGSVLTEWAFDEARQAGDATVLENGTTIYVAVFHDRFREEYNTIDIRHILIQPEDGELAEGDEGYEDEQAQLNADAKAKAEDILAQWKAGEATEDSFAALAMTESADGSKYDGGLYTQVAQGQMVEAFNDWCFDSSRNPGDTGIVETQYGYHVMYFVGDNLPCWQTTVISDLKVDDYSEWETGLSADSVIERGSFGMKFVG